VTGWRHLLRAGALALLAALAGMLPLPALAHSARFGDIAIGHLWAPPPAAGAAGIAVYGALFNRGKAPATLTAAAATIAQQVRFRITKDGQTSWPATIALPPGKPVSLAAWGPHIWLDSPQRTLRAGDSFELTLEFGAAGRVDVEVVVEQAPSD